MFGSTSISRRQLIQSLGLSAATLPFLNNLPCLGASNSAKKRMVIVFSPNGVVLPDFWPKTYGREFELQRIFKPLEAYREHMMVLHGVCDKIRGDGDNHMRGIGCLLTGVELFPGNIQGGSHTPAGWASGISIDQEIKNFLQSRAETRTRFGSLEFGVGVPNHADTWTRMVYSGPNKPIAPIDSPKQMFDLLYGSKQNDELVGSVLDAIQQDLKRLEAVVGSEDRRLIDEHVQMVRSMEKEIELRRSSSNSGHPVPAIDRTIEDTNNNIPQIAKMQIDLMVSAFLADFNRIASLQFTNSVGSARMRWLGIEESHHELSHEPDSNEEAQEKLVKINQWYAEQIAYLVQRLAEIPEPGSTGSMLDHTTIVWTNELGKGNSHTLDNIPFVLIGKGLGFSMGQAIDFPKVPHNRLLLSIAHAMGHKIASFGNKDYCGDGPLTGLV